ncbi:MAG: hypothetical protein NT107_05165 [Planctomycetota bacterium]|nr:hypothetical protein [Planctomycetota bacterium]MSR37733.1 hypothetical protein [Planctomycetota bacterium]
MHSITHQSTAEGSVNGLLVGYQKRFLAGQKALESAKDFAYTAAAMIFATPMFFFLPLHPTLPLAAAPGHASDGS